VNGINHISQEPPKMTTSSYTVVISLAEDPRIKARRWQQKVKTMLGKAARKHFPKGLNSFELMLTKQDYKAKHGKKRIEPKMPKQLLKKAKKFQMREYDEKMDKYQAYVEAHDLAKEAIIESLGPDIREALEHPDNGLENISIGVICTYVEACYGQVTDEDIDKVNAELEAAWDPVIPLPTFIANLAQRFASLEAWAMLSPSMISSCISIVHCPLTHPPPKPSVLPRSKPPSPAHNAHLTKPLQR